MADMTPYTEADCKECNRILYGLNLLLQEFDRQDSIGVDTSEGRLRQADLVKQILAFKAAYFPGR